MLLIMKVLLDLNLAEQDQNAEQAAQPADIASEPGKTRMGPAEIRAPCVKKAQVCLAKAQAHRDRAKREGAERQHPSSPVVPKQNSAVRRGRATGKGAGWEPSAQAAGCGPLQVRWAAKNLCLQQEHS